MDDRLASKILVRLLDLTSLNKDDAKPIIEKLCKKSQTPYGNTAAVCVYPKFILASIGELKQSNIKIATVVNFPSGNASIEKTAEEIRNAIELGADEIDAVFPYKKFIEGDREYCLKYTNMVAKECGNKTSKMILETGELKSGSLIVEATKICIDAGINFIKTSTGKTEISATPEAANLILETIKTSGKDVGFKASGGIKTTYDAKKYLILAISVFGEDWISEKHLRIGASSVLDDLIKTIEER